MSLIRRRGGKRILPTSPHTSQSPSSPSRNYVNFENHSLIPFGSPSSPTTTSSSRRPVYYSPTLITRTKTYSTPSRPLTPPPSSRTRRKSPVVALKVVGFSTPLSGIKVPPKKPAPFKIYEDPAEGEVIVAKRSPRLIAKKKVTRKTSPKKIEPFLKAINMR